MLHPFLGWTTRTIETILGVQAIERLVLSCAYACCCFLDFDETVTDVIATSTGLQDAYDASRDIVASATRLRSHTVNAHAVAYLFDSQVRSASRTFWR